MDTHAGVANAAMMRQPHKNFKHGVPDTTQTPPCHVSMGMPVQSNARKHALENCQRGKARRAAGKSHHHRRCIEGGHDVKASRTALKNMPWALRHAAVQASTKRPHRMLDETRKLSGRGTADTVAAHTKALADAAVRHAGNEVRRMGKTSTAQHACTWWWHGICRLTTSSPAPCHQRGTPQTRESECTPQLPKVGTRQHTPVAEPCRTIRTNTQTPGPPMAEVPVQHGSCLRGRQHELARGRTNTQHSKAEDDDVDGMAAAPARTRRTTVCPAGSARKRKNHVLTATISPVDARESPPKKSLSLTCKTPEVCIMATDVTVICEGRHQAPSAQRPGVWGTSSEARVGLWAGGCVTGCARANVRRSGV